jgi:hypothetical protein
VEVGDVLDMRLVSQGLAGTGFACPESVVHWLTAVQSQDFSAAKWALGRRVPGSRHADIQSAFDEGRLLRTHILRPTWHFVAPSDIRWMQRLTSPHVKRISASYLRKLGLDGDLVGRATKVLTRAIQDGGALTKSAIHDALAEHGFELDLFRLGFIIMEAELDALICSGPMQGKQHTYTLLNDRVSNETELTGDEALAELSRRFFESHGPATDREYARWSGLTLTNARRGLEMAKESLTPVEIEGIVHWHGANTPVSGELPNGAYLLHEYDECYLTYLTLGFADLPHDRSAAEWEDTFFRPIIINGMRAGTWRRSIARKQVKIEVNLFTRLSRRQLELLEAEVARYGEFLGMPAHLSIPSS